MKSLFISLLLVLSSILYSQNDGFYRLYLEDDTFIDAKKVSQLKDRTNYETLDGKTSYIDNYKLLHLRFITDTKEKFEYKDKILNTSIVYQMEGLSAQEIFIRAKNWVITNYKNPDEVLKALIENELIRFSGVSSESLIVGGSGLSLGYTCRLHYTISLNFKNGKYKMEITEIYMRIPLTINPNDVTTSLFDITGFYNKKGKIINMWKLIPFQAEDALNEISDSLFNYIKEGGEKSNNDW